MYLDIGESRTFLKSQGTHCTNLGTPLSDTKVRNLLLEQVRTGNSDAFALLVRQHDAMVLRTALRLLGNIEDAQDAAQEAFLRLYKYRQRIDSYREIQPWLYRLTVNACRDLAKRKQRLKTSPLTQAQSEYISAPHKSDASARHDEKQAWLECALLDLSPREREAIVLRDMEGLDTKEVARALGITQVTVRSQICRARTKLRVAYTSHFGEEL